MDSMSLSSEYASSTTITLAITLLVARGYGAWRGCNGSAKQPPPSTVERANMTPPDTVEPRSIAPSWRSAVSALVSRERQIGDGRGGCRDAWAGGHMMWP